MISYPTYRFESGLPLYGFNYIVGVDEAGRGPGAGPVVASAVKIPYDVHKKFLGRVRDSKTLSEKARNSLSEEINLECDVGVGVITNEIIDEINILEATKLAMFMAVKELNEADFLLIDGTVKLYGLNIPQVQMIKGDSRILSISAAGIIAKVTRDAMMYELDKKYPIYMWKKNKGYLTKEHMKAIQEYGPCKYHRKTFKRVKEYVNG